MLTLKKFQVRLDSLLYKYCTVVRVLAAQLFIETNELFEGLRLLIYSPLLVDGSFSSRCRTVIFLSS